MKITRVISLILFIVILIIQMYSCADKKQTSSDIVNSMSKTNAESNTVSDNGSASVCKVPESLDWKGREFQISYPAWQGYLTDFFSDELNGEIMNDAIYRRNQIVEEYLNIKLKAINDGNIAEQNSKVRNMIYAGDCPYSLVLTHCIFGLYNLVSNNCLYNWNQIGYVDFTADWWNQNSISEMQISDKLYYTTSDFMIKCPYVVLFSKNLVDSYNLSNPYDLVTSGSWTIDNFISMAIATTNDIDGDGQYTFNDCYGMTYTHPSLMSEFMSGCGIRLTERNNNNILLSDNVSKMDALITKLYSAIDGNHILYSDGYYYSDNSKPYLTFDSGRVLFVLNSLFGVESYRDCDTDFGILPFPKYDESQTKYLSTDWGGFMCVPATITDTDFVGSVCEFLSYTNSYEVLPAYYDIILKEKMIRDNESEAMLDVIFNGVTYDIGRSYFGSEPAFSSLIDALVKKRDYASFFAQLQPSAQILLDKINGNKSTN